MLNVSFEFFPPKSEKLAESLWQAAARLAPLAPKFVSVTYGAGGTTRDRTHETVLRLQNELGLAAAAHLTCVGADRAEINSIAQHYWQSGIRHIVALRGDAPAQDGIYRPHADGYAYAADLVGGLQALAPFEISVAAYPEKHPEAASFEADLDNLKRKIDAGATRAITQFFFDNEVFLRFRDMAVRAGITVPLVPGILPITNFQRTVDFAQKCGARIPPRVANQFEGLNEEAEIRPLISAVLATEQCQQLCAEGVSDLHFYTLNRADLTLAICHMLGVRAKVLPA